MKGAEAESSRAPRTIGRYVLHDEIAAGGMATVHIGRLVAPVGFSRTVAIKCLHPQFAKDPEFVSMFLDEARLAARIRHPNVVATLDVVALQGELFLVMEYVQGESLAKLIRRCLDAQTILPRNVVVAVLSGMLQGLHAAHEAKNEQGNPLEIVHRDVSPQNVLVGLDGVSRVLDFGVAKAIGRLQTTRDGQIKGKTAYMAPEQLRGRPVDRRTDVYAASVVLWEALTRQRLFKGDTPAEIMNAILEKRIEPPSFHATDVPAAIDAIVLKGLARKPENRFATALEMSVALEEAMVPATARQVGEWVTSICGDTLRDRAERVHAIEREPITGDDATKTDVSSSRVTPATTTRERSLEEPTGTGSVSMATPASLSPRGGGARRRNVAMIVLAAAIVFGGAGLWIFQGNRDRAPTASTASVPSESIVAVPSVTPSATSITSIAPTPISTSATPAASTAETAKPKTKIKPATKAKPTSTAKTPNCNPPYTVDPEGVHIPKPECE